MTKPSKDSAPEATQSELTSEQLDEISGGLMSVEPTDGEGDGGSGGGTTTTTAGGTVTPTGDGSLSYQDQLDAIKKAMGAQANLWSSVTNIGR